MRAMANGTSLLASPSNSSTYPGLSTGLRTRSKQRPYAAHGWRSCRSQGMAWSVLAVLRPAAPKLRCARSALSTKRPSWPWRDQLTCLLPDRPAGSSPQPLGRNQPHRGAGTRASGSPRMPKVSALVPVAAAARWPRMRGIPRTNQLVCHPRPSSSSMPSHTEPWAVCHGFRILDIHRTHWGNEDCDCGASAAPIG